LIIPWSNSVHFWDIFGPGKFTQTTQVIFIVRPVYFHKIISLVFSFDKCLLKLKSGYRIRLNKARKIELRYYMKGMPSNTLNSIFLALFNLIL